MEVVENGFYWKQIHTDGSGSSGRRCVVLPGGSKERWNLRGVLVVVENGSYWKQLKKEGALCSTTCI